MWTALKAQQWVDCIASAQELGKNTKKIPLQCEASLLEAYCMMMQKKYIEAVNILQAAYTKISAYTGPSETEKSERQGTYQNSRNDYEALANEAKQLAMTTQTSAIISSIDSLHTPQMKTQNKITDDLRYFDEFVRSSFFARDAGTVRDDIEYALAKSQKMAGMRATEKAVEKETEKAQEIDEEMKKIEQELNQIQNKPDSE
jgi:hypothetical protein